MFFSEHTMLSARAEMDFAGECSDTQRELGDCSS
jgi:hypothetical protein